MRKIVPLILLALLFPASASAKLTTDEQRLRYFTPVAEKAFPSPCNGHMQVDIADPTGLAGPVLLDGFAFANTCHIMVKPGLGDYRFCLVLVHEYGHIAGYRHEATGIMNPNSGDYQPCELATFDSVTDREAIEQMFQGRIVSLKRIRRGTRAYREGIRWVLHSASGHRWLVDGTGRNITISLDS